MKNKVTIIGAGMVGSTIAYSLIMRDSAEEVAMVDVNEELVEAQVMDLQHAVPFTGQTEIKVGAYEDCADSRVAVITCGVSQKKGETRLDLVERNAQIIKQIVPLIFEQNPDIVLVMVTNPVDILTRLAIDLFPEKKDQIMGSGTILDSARFRHLIGREMNINPRSIHAYILGEHGDSEFPVWSMAQIGNMKMDSCEYLAEDKKEEIFSKAKNAAYAIIEGKQSTYYGIGSGASYLVHTILHDKKTVLPVSHLMTGAYGVKDVCLSMPVVIGRGGITKRICVELSTEEQKLLRHSAQVLNDVYKSI